MSAISGPITLDAAQLAIGNLVAQGNSQSRLAQLPRKFHDLVTASPAKAVGAILTLGSEELGAVAAVTCQPASTGGLAPTHMYAPASRRTAADGLLGELMAAARSAAANRCLRITTSGAANGCQIVAAPIVDPDRPAGAIVFCLPPGSQPSDHAAAVALYAAAWTCLAGGMPSVSGSNAATDSNEPNSSTINRLCAQATAAADLKSALMSLVNELRTWLECDTFCIVLPRGNADARVAAISNVSTFDRRSALAGAFEAAAREVMLVDRPQSFPSGDGAPAAANLGELCRQEASPRAYSWPCRDASGKIACVCVALLPDGFVAEDRLQAMRQGSDTIGATVGLLRLGHASVPGRMLHNASCAVRALCRARYFALAASLLAVLMCAPWTYDLPCQCVVEPVTRRVVCAPFDGVLDRTHVRPGDRVWAGDVLASMDGHELDLQLASRQALIEQARQRYTAALAKRDAAAAQFASLELEQAELEVGLINHRRKNLQIRSPLDGIVVSGDLHRAEGAPLSVGQKLFEVAPLEHMVVEASVPEHEIAAVAQGQSVSLSLQSHPGVGLRGEVIRLHPQAEIHNQKSVFIAEVQLQADEAPLLPGMSGQAQIEVGSRPIGWILFHRPWYYLRSRLLW